jgi:hypothetical protein
MQVGRIHKASRVTLSHEQIINLREIGGLLRDVRTGEHADVLDIRYTLAQLDKIAEAVLEYIHCCEVDYGGPDWDGAWDDVCSAVYDRYGERMHE